MSIVYLEPNVQEHATIQYNLRHVLQQAVAASKRFL